MSASYSPGGVSTPSEIGSTLDHKQRTIIMGQARQLGHVFQKAKEVRALDNHGRGWSGERR